LAFENFRDDMGEPPTPKHQLERGKNDQGYCKENCRWATPKEQARNRRSSRLLEYKGKTQTLQAWADELGLKREAIGMRLRYGWTIEEAFETPVRGWAPGRKKPEE
jgi:hypothetical protein